MPFVSFLAFWLARNCFRINHNREGEERGELEEAKEFFFYGENEKFLIHEEGEKFGVARFQKELSVSALFGLFL